MGSSLVYLMEAAECYGFEGVVVEVSSGQLLLECWGCRVGLIAMVKAGWMCVRLGFADDSASFNSG